MSNIKAIIFDIGGVVTLGSFHELYKNFAALVGLTPEFILDYHKQNRDNLTLGYITLDQFFSYFKKAGTKFDGDLQEAYTEEMIKVRPINLELVNMLATLRQHYTLGVLSNLTWTRWVADERMGIYKNFDFTVLSCMEHLKKPDPKFYQLALTRAGVQPAEAIFIDDNEAYVAAAREVGLKDILFTDNNKLFEDLRKLGVEIK
jgi:epoxide hydrolase-like predicted phosphatase